jgi:hypothetical protein
MPVSKPAGIVPVGGVIAWLKSLTNTPTLPSEWLECNGQALTGGSADAQSVYNGGTIPNLNGASSGTKRFLRGSATSGGSADNESHSHSVDICLGTIEAWGTSSCSGGNGSFSVNTGSASSLPSYYEVVWILRIK